jgi:hypothetical protein
MKFTGATDDNGQSLKVEISGENWGLRIRRVDDAEDRRLEHHVGKELSVADILEILPNAKAIEFEKPTTSGARSELRAIDGEYAVMIRFPASATYFDPDAVIEAFRDLFT